MTPAAVSGRQGALLPPMASSSARDRESVQQQIRTDLQLGGPRRTTEAHNRVSASNGVDRRLRSGTRPDRLGAIIDTVRGKSV